MHHRIVRLGALGALTSFPAAAQTFHGPTAYLSSADSPFALSSGAFALEDFEDGLLNTPGVSSLSGYVTSTHYSGTIIDSVDSDDGVLGNNACASCDSYFGGNRFVFDAAVLGGLPTKAGLVWTDGGPNATVTFEAFDADGLTLGTVVASGQGDGTYYGTSVDDRFYGVEYAGGIKEIRISHTAGGIEVDHLQYEVPCAGAMAATYCTAKTASLGCVPSIALQGCPSVSSTLAASVVCTQVVSGKSGLLFYGFAPASSPFQGGFLCVQPPTLRTPIQNSGGAANTCAGQFAFDFNAHIQSGVDPNLINGAQVRAQYWYRDPASASTTGLSNGLSFKIGP
jgi:hypothetical protein